MPRRFDYWSSFDSCITDIDFTGASGGFSIIRCHSRQTGWVKYLSGVVTSLNTYSPNPLEQFPNTTVNISPCSSSAFIRLSPGGSLAIILVARDTNYFNCYWGSSHRGQYWTLMFECFRITGLIKIWYNYYCIVCMLKTWKKKNFHRLYRVYSALIHVIPVYSSAQIEMVKCDQRWSCES